jgi:hypothetical protein
MFRSCIRLLVLLTAFGCHKKNEVKSSEELESIVNSFYKEWSVRSAGSDISPESLLIGFGNIDGKAGRCTPNSYPKVITIDSLLWRVLTHQQKEMLVYHELAHCVLSRKHNNEILRFGECASWMREYDSLCTINLINNAWREHYLNELFGAEAISAPRWYNVGEQVPADNSLKVVAGKIDLSNSNTLLFDTAFFHERNDWVLKIDFVAPEKIIGHLGISINEYWVEFSSYKNLAPSPHVVSSKSIMLNQPTFLRISEIVVWDTLQSIHETPKLCIKKHGEAIFIFFQDELKVSIPIAERKITISGYSTFKVENAYKILVSKL